MPNSVDFSGRPFHFIGIGGIGMSALAYVLAKRHLPVSGSDIRSSHITQRLQEVGAHIFVSQSGTNLEFFQPTTDSVATVPTGAVVGVSDPQGMSMEPMLNGGLAKALPPRYLPQVICSTAINPTNSEYIAAIERGCPIFHRSDLLAALIQDYQSIAVAGTHGKTTTSSLIGYILLQAGIDPTIVVGGEVNAWEGNARVGSGSYLVAEADESDGSLVKFSPAIGVVTNIELDHTDHYQTLEEVITTFKIFAEHCQTLVGCLDCETVRYRLRPKIGYSLNWDSDADYTVDCVTYSPEGTSARVWERGEILGQLNLLLLGQHNLSNALAAVAVGRLVGLEFEAIASSIATFEGARRRFELRGQCNGICFVDDYAHHPSEIRATCAAARLRKGTRNGSGSSPGRVVAIFQPHRYSRTLALLPDFAQSFKDADIVVISDIYSAGEPDLGKVSGQELADLIATYNSRVYYQPSLQLVSTLLQEILRPGDLALFLGAGNLNQIIPDLLNFYQQNKSSLSPAFS